MSKRWWGRVSSYLERHEPALNVLNTASVALFTAVLAVSTLALWKETRDLRNFAQEQSDDTKAAIKEAVRSADAMQQVADAVTRSAKSTEASVALFKDANIRQMRAYLTVGLGGVIEQNATTNYRFEVRMTVQNVGNTPAYHVAFVTQANALPFPLPADFEFPSLPDTTRSAAVIGPHQSFIVSGVAPKIYSDDEINDLKNGTSKHFYIYGTISYEDAFGEKRNTNFSQALMPLKGGTYMTLNTPQHNDAD